MLTRVTSIVCESFSSRSTTGHTSKNGCRGYPSSRGSNEAISQSIEPVRIWLGALVRPCQTGASCRRGRETCAFVIGALRKSIKKRSKKSLASGGTLGDLSLDWISDDRVYKVC